MTPEDIFTAALAKSSKNKPGVTATPTELLSLFNRVYPVFWTIGARVNPSFFGKWQVVGFGGESGVDAWCRPTDAELIYLIDNEAGEEVIVVPLEEPDADPFRPAVYEWGQCYYPAGNELDPADTEDLTFWYSKKPEVAATADQELERLWPTNFGELLALELAIVLAMKDDRTEEIAHLRGDRDSWLRRFIAHLEHSTVGIVRSTGSAQRFQAQTVVPLTDLLAGGSEVAL